MPLYVILELKGKLEVKVVPTAISRGNYTAKGQLSFKGRSRWGRCKFSKSLNPQ